MTSIQLFNMKPVASIMNIRSASVVICNARNFGGANYDASVIIDDVGTVLLFIRQLPTTLASYISCIVLTTS